jgi:hypothetical protein
MAMSAQLKLSRSLGTVLALLAIGFLAALAI